MGAGAEEIRSLAQLAIEEADLSISADKPRVVEARAFKTYQVTVRTRFERRSVVWSLRPAPRLSALAELTAVDPWSVAINVPHDGRASNERYTMSDAEQHGLCPRCDPDGFLECEHCAGAGQTSRVRERPGFEIGTETLVFECFACSGKRRAPCRHCDGRRAVTAVPVVIVETGTVSRTRSIEPEVLPDELALHIAGVELSGKPICKEEGDAHAATSERLGLSGSPPRVSLEVDAIIDVLLEEDPVDGLHRLRGRALEVHEVVHYEAELDSGHTAFVCGSPATVFPEGVLGHRRGIVGTIASWFGRRSS